MLESRFVEFGPGRNVHAQIGGTGPTVVFFPGNGGSIADFLPVMQQLAVDHRVVGIDLPGRSETDWPDVRFDFAADLQPVIDWTLSQLGVGSHIIVGHGSGALVALHHAQRHFGQVQGVAMIEGYVNKEAQQRTAAKRYRRPVRMSEQLVEAFEQRRKNHAAWLNHHNTFRESFNATQRAYDASEWVSELEIPIQVILGHQEQKLPAISDDAGWRQQLNLLEVDTLYVSLIENAGYWVMFDDPQKVSDALRHFAKQVYQEQS